MALTISATDTEAQKPVNVIMQQTLLRNARIQACYFTGSQPGTLIRHGGSATAKWRRYNTSADNSSGISPSVTALSELTTNAAYGQGRTPDTVHFSDVTAAVSKYGQYYILNEEVDVFNFNPDMDGIARTMGITGGRAANFLHRDTMEDNVTLRYAGNVASDGAVVTAAAVADFDRIVNELARNYGDPFTPMGNGSQNIGTVPLNQGFWAFTHPDVAYDVSKFTGFISAKQYATHTEIAPGEFGAYERAGYSVRFIQTPEASIDTGSGGTVTSTPDLRATSGNADLYTTVVIARDAHGSLGFGDQWGDGVYRAGEGNPSAIEMIPGGRLINAPAGPGDPFKELGTLAYKFWYGGAILNSNWARGLRSGATNLTN